MTLKSAIFLNGGKLRPLNEIPYPHATSAFESTTKRTPIGADSSSSSSCGSVIRRLRSLSGFSRRLTMGSDDAFADDASGAPRGEVVNNVRGSGFPEISLDDLAIEIFCSSGDTGMPEFRRESDVSPLNAVGNGRRGRTVSRKGSSGCSGSYKSGGGSSNSEFARRRRSVSVGRCQISDSESHATKVKTSRGRSQSRKPNAINSGQALKPYDDYSVILISNPSLAHGYKLHLDNGDVLQAISSVRRSFTTKLPQQHGKEISKIVKDLLAESKSTGEEKTRSRERSNDRCGTSKSLSEEAEKYIQDFVSNVEDTEISSLDGERSDTSSSMGGLLKLDNVQTTADCQPPVEMDGVVLPWLHWETCNDVSTPSCEEQSMWSPPTGKFK